ncbi:MAG: DeoR family transcriptional regulator [Thermoplasmata archaeon]|nr:DeoR family transcriptional regulator [Thermoplasmata archaeon]
MDRPETPPKTEPAHGHSTGLIETAARLNRDYIPWDDLRSKEGLGHPPEDIWRAMSSLRRATRSTVHIGKIAFSWNLTPAIISRLHNIDMGHSGGKVTGHRLNRHTRKTFSVDATMDESVASAVLAGAQLHGPEAKKFLREGRPPRNGTESLLGGTYSLIGLARSNADKELDPDLLLMFNRAVSGPGARYRDSDDIITAGESREPLLTPFPRRKIPGAVADMAAFAADESNHPLVRAFALEYMVLRVAPFAENNGPTARAAASWCMARNGYGIDTFLSISSVRRSRSARYRRMFEISEAEDDDMTYAVSFCLEAMEEAISAFVSNADRRYRESADLLEGLSVADLNLRQKTILSDMIRSPTGLTIGEIAAKHQVSYQTARADLILLDRRGLARKGGREGHRDTYVYTGSPRP